MRPSTEFAVAAALATWAEDLRFSVIRTPMSLSWSAGVSFLVCRCQLNVPQAVNKLRVLGSNIHNFALLTVKIEKPLHAPLMELIKILLKVFNICNIFVSSVYFLRHL